MELLHSTGTQPDLIELPKVIQAITKFSSPNWKLQMSPLTFASTLKLDIDGCRKTASLILGSLLHSS